MLIKDLSVFLRYFKKRIESINNKAFAKKLS